MNNDQLTFLNAQKYTRSSLFVLAFQFQAFEVVHYFAG